MQLMTFQIMQTGGLFVQLYENESFIEHKCKLKNARRDRVHEFCLTLCLQMSACVCVSLQLDVCLLM